jgi:TolB-like protein
MTGKRYEFGSFELDTARRILLKNGSPIIIGQKCLLLLEALIGAEGRVVSKSALMDAAWNTSNIEESNLSVQIAALRKCLGKSRSGEEWIATVQRVGYQFVKPAEAGDASSVHAILEATEGPSEKPSIAVLPFMNMSSDPEQEYFADGIAEDLITDLSKIAGLLVIARHSSFAYKGKPLDIQKIASDLRVRYIVEGSVRRAAGRVRINTQLVDTSTNVHLWADRFDRELTDIFELQDEVTAKIVNALAIMFPSGQSATRQRANNLEAYDFFVRGRAMVTEAPERNKTGRELLNSAIKLEPDFADAHAWLAASFLFPWAYWNEVIETNRPLAREAAERAVNIDPQNAVAHGILGTVLLYERRPTEAAAELREALKISPNHADAWMLMADLQVMEGRADEGVASARKAFHLNPHPPAFYHWGLGYTEYAAGKYNEAIRTLQHESTYHLGSKRILAASLAQVGRLDEAKAEAELFLASHPYFTIEYWASTQPFRYERDRQHFIDGYVKAGLPM